MAYDEPTVSEELIFDGRVVRLKKLTVELPNGRTSTREVIEHPGAVAVLAEPQKDHILLVKQYRKACGKALWEIPAGKLEPNEDPKAAAIRELSEETGYVAHHIEKVYGFFTSPGFANERLSVYYASHLSEGASHPDEDEFLELISVDRTEVQRMMDSGEIEDAKTLVALLWWFQRSR
jgi:ADP-ribose pyrophosphatase